MVGSQAGKDDRRIIVSDDVRPQDDFYRYVCQHWKDDNPRPADQVCWSRLSQLATKVDDQVAAIFADWLKRGAKLTAGQRQAVELYKTYLAKDRLASASAATLVDIHQRLIQPINSTNQAAYLGQLTRIGLTTPWDFSVDTNPHDPTRFILSLVQSDLNLPGRAYYLSRSPRLKATRLAYRRFIRQFWRRSRSELGRLTGTPPPFVRLSSVQLLKLESALAQWSAPHEQVIHPRRSTNVYSLFELQATFDFDWPGYFRSLGLKTPPRYINVAQPDFLQAAVRWLRAASPAELKLYLTWQLLLGLAPRVNESLMADYFGFFGRTLYGQAEIKTLELRARQFVSRELIDTIGREYVRRHFPAKHQQAIRALSDEIKLALTRRLRAAKWLTDSGRQAALKKLERISINLGRPRTWASYQQLKLDRRNLVQTRVNLEAFNTDWSLRLLGQRPNRYNFNLGPGSFGSHFVDAWTDPCLLTTNYTAAILQPPFYDPSADWAFNLGSVGSVIGHELTHHFDNLGAHYNADGRLRDWLAPAERQAFQKAAQPLLRAAARFEVLPKVRLKAHQVLGELLADLGGLVLVSEIVAQRYPNRTLRQQIYRRVLEAYAYYNAENASPELRIMRVQSDEHPDSVFRVNGIVSHLPAFYEAYDLKPTDKLYRPSTERAQVW